MKDYQIPRELIGQVFTNPRSARAFENLMARVVEVDAATTLAVAATERLNDAAFVTLSPNAELPNERVLQFGSGISGSITDTTLTLALTNAAVHSDGEFRISLVAEGDTILGAPLSGYLATREWVHGSSNNARTITASGNVAGSDVMILADATSAAITLSLPAAVASKGKRLIVKKIDASANAITIDPSGTETIDGAATVSLSAQYQSVTIVCDGSTWWKA